MAVGTTLAGNANETADGIKVVSEQRANPTSGEQEFITKTKNEDLEGIVATETTLAGAKTTLDSIDGKDFATQDTLNQVLTELGNVKTKLDALTDGSQKVSLNGSKVSEVTLVDAKAIRDTVGYTVGFDSSNYSDFYFYAKNTLDVDVELQIHPKGAGSGHGYYDGTQFLKNVTITIPADGGYFNCFYHEMVSQGLKRVIREGSFGLYYKCDVAPTTGTFSLWVERGN